MMQPRIVLILIVTVLGCFGMQELGNELRSSSISPVSGTQVVKDVLFVFSISDPVDGQMLPEPDAYHSSDYSYYDYNNFRDPYHVIGTGEPGAQVLLNFSDELPLSPDIVASVTVEADGSWSYFLDYTPLGENILLEATQTDLAGNEASISLTLTNFIAPRRTTVVEPVANSYVNSGVASALPVKIQIGNTGSLLWYLEIIDKNGAKFGPVAGEIVVSRGTYGYWGLNVTADVHLLADGPLYISSIQLLNVQLSTYYNYEHIVIKDTTAVVTASVNSATITQQIALFGTGDSGSTITITVSDSQGNPNVEQTVLVETDSTSWMANVNVGSLAEGALNILIVLEDVAGNTDSTSLNVIKDNTPANDDCINALQLLPGSSIFALNEYASNTDSVSFSTPCGIESQSTENMWYYIDITVAGTLILSTCNVQTNFDTVLAIYSGSCSNLICEGSNNDGVSSGCGLKSELSVSLNPGRYYVMVSGLLGSSSPRGNFNLQSTFNPSITVGGDPHGIDFHAVPFELPVHVESPASYRLMEDHQMDVLCLVHKSFIREIHIDFIDLKSHFTAHVNATSGDPEFVWNDQIIATPQEILVEDLLVEVFFLDKSIIDHEATGLNQLARYQSIGVRLGTKVTIVGGYVPRAGAFFNVQLSPDNSMVLNRPSIANLLSSIPNRTRNLSEWESVFAPARLEL